MIVDLVRLKELHNFHEIRVNAEDTQSAAQSFVKGQHDLADLLSLLGSSLASASKAIGSDHTAKVLSQSYKTAASTIMQGCSTLNDLLGGIANGLAQSATNHALADATHAVSAPEYTVKTAGSLTTPNIPDTTGFSHWWFLEGSIDLDKVNERQLILDVMIGVVDGGYARIGTVPADSDGFMEITQKGKDYAATLDTAKFDTQIDQYFGDI
jgi:uncharacterized protein YukE